MSITHNRRIRSRIKRLFNSHSVVRGRGCERVGSSFRFRVGKRFLPARLKRIEHSVQSGSSYRSAIGVAYTAGTRIRLSRRIHRATSGIGGERGGEYFSRSNSRIRFEVEQSIRTPIRRSLGIGTCGQ